MKEKHITEVLDNTALASLSHIELDEIRAHARECQLCSATLCTGHEGAGPSGD